MSPLDLGKRWLPRFAGAPYGSVPCRDGWREGTPTAAWLPSLNVPCQPGGPAGCQPKAPAEAASRPRGPAHRSGQTFSKVAPNPHPASVTFSPFPGPLRSRHWAALSSCPGRGLPPGAKAACSQAAAAAGRTGVRGSGAGWHPRGRGSRRECARAAVAVPEQPPSQGQGRGFPAPVGGHDAGPQTRGGAAGSPPRARPRGPAPRVRGSRGPRPHGRPARSLSGSSRGRGNSPPRGTPGKSQCGGVSWARPTERGLRPGPSQPLGPRPTGPCSLPPPGGSRAPLPLLPLPSGALAWG